MKENLILIIEDEPRVADMLSRGLQEYGYATEIACDGLQGKQMLLSKKHDAIILDINIPHINGFDLCKDFRALDKNTPILMLTAMGTMNNKLIGFESGADDYIIKPFEFKELLARLKVFISRSENVSNSSVKKVKHLDLEIDLDSRAVKRADKRIELSLKEYQLLLLLISNKGKVLTRSEIAEKVWEINFDTGTNIIDVYVNYLRKKIDKDFEKKIIQTVFGVGYIIKDEENCFP